MIGSFTPNGLYAAVLFVGYAGCGKGTQAKLLAQRSAFHHLSSGDEFRKITEPEADSVLKPYQLDIERRMKARKAQQAIEAGNLADDEIAFDLVRMTLDDRVKSASFTPSSQTLALDGFARRSSQVPLMYSIAHTIKVLHIHVPRDYAFERVKSRAIKEGRIDDAKPESINRRLDLCEKETLPMLGELGAKVELIDGMQDIEAVYKSVFRICDAAVRRYNRRD